MDRIFNVNADCRPKLHYMVDIESRVEKIQKMVDAGQYFTINRARQYGKTTILKALERSLKEKYEVISLDFQMMSFSKFRNENTFSVAFARDFIDAFETNNYGKPPLDAISALKTALKENKSELELFELFKYLSNICAESLQPMVLIIDEVDSAANDQVFVDFLAQLRGYYVKREVKSTFLSVILAGVYDIKNIKRKFSADQEHKTNSPWNIAADFLIDMSFSEKDISGMLMDYEADHRTSMNISEISALLYDYTSGYPFLVSRLCKLMDERIAGTEKFPDKHHAWTKAGFLEAVRILLNEKNTLFDSLFNKLEDYPELMNVIYALLFQGRGVMYNPDDPAVDIALMFGFLKADGESLQIANRIFETRLYNYFLTLPEIQDNGLYKAAYQCKNQFIKNGHLDMKMVLEKFVVYFDDIYGDREQRFAEEDGRRYFMLYLKPIINGTGNYYIEVQTRNMERMDMVIDYRGEQFVVEMKIWRGNAYNTRGEEQLADYLEYYHMNKGYMLSFNFNQKKEIGVREIVLGDKVLVEAVV